ncbi:MAG: thioredoxin family protein [Planctomycetes bacterium]|nr:thioredoxin family protein [Planctomycetota bacterium]
MVRVLSLVLLLAAIAAPAQAGQGWLTNLEKAKKVAKAKKLPILVEFTGSDWCKPCIILKKEVMGSKEFKATAKGYVLVELDFPRRKRQDKSVKARNAKLQAKYKVEGFPTVLFLDYEGKEIGRTVGFAKGNKTKWLAKVKALLAAGFNASTGKAGKPGKSGKSGGADGGWQTNYDAAVALSRKTGKPILADFTGSDWCGWCIRLKKEVFNTSEFKAWAKENVILLEVDFPSRAPQSDALKKQNKALAEKYSIEGFPTVLMLDADGTLIGTTGYVKGGPKAWIVEGEKALGMRGK